jgi:hypothetical protein
MTRVATKTVVVWEPPLDRLAAATPAPPAAACSSTNRRV